MALFGKKNRHIGEHLRKTASEVSGKKRPKKRGVRGEFLSDRDVCEYFMKVGLDHKGDFQSYRFAKGSSKAVTLEVDLVALAAACAGVPVPETPVFATVGLKARVKNTRNNLVAALVCPKAIEVDGRTLSTVECGQILFLGMTGYHWESGIDFTAEVGVQAKVPKLPSFGTGKGEYGGDEDKKTEVESGTYAELAAFEIDVSAKASVQGHAGISGERLYLSDTVPTFIQKQNGIREIEKNLTLVLKHGDKKACIKDEIKEFLKAHQREQKRSVFKKLISGGNVSSSQLTQALEGLEAATQEEPVKQICRHHIRSLADFKDQNVLGPYNFISLWGMKPEAGAGIGASAGASVKAEAGGLARAGVEVGVALKGPAIETSLKFTRFRFQAAGLAREQGKSHPLFSRNSRLQGNHVGARVQGIHRNLVESLPQSAPASAYVIMTQDTSITYGQMNLTLLEASAKADIGIEQGLFSAGRLQTGASGGLTGKKGLAIAGMSGEAKVGLEEIRAKGEATAGLKSALNFMQYESAVAFWAPPQSPGRKPNETVAVNLAQGSGFALGQSVDVWQFNQYLEQILADPDRKCGYMQALAGRLCVKYSELKTFLLEHGATGLIGDIAHLTRLGKAERKKYEAHLPSPTAFLIESSFALRELKKTTVDAVWSKKKRWVLGPGGRGKTLRGAFMGKKPWEKGALQAIRLRYRLADEMSEERARFSLGIKYIVKFGIEYNSVEEAGSEGIINLGTTWYGDLASYNVNPGQGHSVAQTTAYEKAVPQVVLLHQ